MISKEKNKKVATNHLQLDINELLARVDEKDRLDIMSNLLIADVLPCYKYYIQHKVLELGLLLLRESPCIINDLFNLLINQDQKGQQLLEQIHKTFLGNQKDNDDFIKAYKFFNYDYYSIFDNEESSTHSYAWCDTLRLSLFYLIKVKDGQIFE